MGRSRGSSYPWALVLLLGASACVDPQVWPRIPPVTWSGEELYYAPEYGVDEPCEGTLPYMDRYITLVSDAIGGTARGPVRFIHASEDAPSRCWDDDAFGCARWDYVSSPTIPGEHALVHGVRFHAEWSQIFIEEGTAELYGDDATMSLRVPAHGDLMEGLASSDEDGYLTLDWFPRAGHFTAFLYDRYGQEMSGKLLSWTNVNASSDGLVSTIEDLTRTPFSEILAEYEAQPTCDQAHYRYPVYACDAAEALRARCDGEVAIELGERIACDDPTTIGPRDGEIWKIIGIEVPQDGDYELSARTTEGPARASLVLKECSMKCDSIRIERTIDAELPAEPVFLRAGRYEVRLTRPLGAPGSVALRIAGSDCG